jgi:hypothetical protein
MINIQYNQDICYLCSKHFKDPVDRLEIIEMMKPLIKIDDPYNHINLHDWKI